MMIDPYLRNAIKRASEQIDPPPSDVEQLLAELLRSGLVSTQAYDALSEKSLATLARVSQCNYLLTHLVDFKLLTPYQAERIRIGNVQGLMLGDYRLLDRLGVGDTSVVFRGEHRETGQSVAIKVLIPSRDQDPKLMLRFFAERKTVAQLAHPGIVRAVDLGESTSNDPDEPVLYYYVMEQISGLDLEQYVQKHGPMPPALACKIAFQVADALTEIQANDLVHRGIKPSDILFTPEGQAMLLDFGLVRQFDSRQTIEGSLVGMLEWIAPEQVLNAHTVDIRADIYSLGCTLFWCLTGQSPHGAKKTLPGTPVQSLMQRPTPLVRSVRSEIAPALETLIARMMAPLAENRFPDPRAVMVALAPFVHEVEIVTSSPAEDVEEHVSPSQTPTPEPRILIVTGDAVIRRICSDAMQIEGLAHRVCENGELALAIVAEEAPSLVMLDVASTLTGVEVLDRLRNDPRGAGWKFIVLVDENCDIPALLTAGASDSLSKPIGGVKLRLRINSVLRRKSAPLPSRQQPPLAPGPRQDQPEVPDMPRMWQPALNWLLGRKKESTSS